MRRSKMKDNLVYLFFLFFFEKLKMICDIDVEYWFSKVYDCACFVSHSIVISMLFLFLQDIE